MQVAIIRRDHYYDSQLVCRNVTGSVVSTRVWYGKAHVPRSWFGGCMSLAGRVKSIIPLNRKVLQRAEGAQTALTKPQRAVRSRNVTSLDDGAFA